MYFIKDNVTGSEVKLYDEDIYTYCPECGKRLYPFRNVGLSEFLEGFDDDVELEFATTTMVCDDCLKKIKKAEKGKLYHYGHRG